MRSRVVESIDQLDAERWDALSGGQIAMSYRWQRVMEASRPRYRPRYVLLEDERGPLAAAVANMAGAFGRNGWREVLLRRLTVAVGAAFSSRHSGVALRSGADLGAVLPELDAIFVDLCRRGTRPLIGVSNVMETDLPIWRARGYFAVRQRDHMVLDLQGQSYDEYVQQLSKDDRKELSRVKRRAAELGVELSFDPLAGQGDQLYPLMAEIYARHGTPLPAMPFTAALFSAMEREMPGEAVVLSGRVRGQLAGFFLGIRRGDEMQWPVAGLHYELARPSCLYFVMLDELIRSGIAQGFRRIYAGMTNERQKARHGFHPHQRWFCVRAHPNPLGHVLTFALARRERARLLPAHAT